MMMESGVMRFAGGILRLAAAIQTGCQPAARQAAYSDAFYSRGWTWRNGVTMLKIWESVVPGAAECQGLTADDNGQQLCERESVGHKRIQKFKYAEAAGIRLRCTESVARPRIRPLTFYNAG